MVTAHFDNSEANAHNPDSSKAIRHGSATFDEMMIGFTDYIIPRPHERLIAKVNPATFDAYVGEYEIDATAIINIIRIGDKIYAEAAGQRIELHPISETVFFSRNTESELSFIKNEKQEVSGFVVTQNKGSSGLNELSKDGFGTLQEVSAKRLRWQ